MIPFKLEFFVWFKRYIEFLINLDLNIKLKKELEEYKKISHLSEKDLETLKRKYSVVRHQISLLYRDYIDESKTWKSEKENLVNTIKKLNDVISVDSVKLQEYQVT